MGQAPVDQSDQLILACSIILYYRARFHSTNTAKSVEVFEHRIVDVGSFAPNAACFSVDIVLCSSFHDKILQQISEMFFSTKLPVKFHGSFLGPWHVDKVPLYFKNIKFRNMNSLMEKIWQSIVETTDTVLT